MKHQIKYQSKLTYFAGVLLQALLLLVPISACAATETNQEIGVPQPMDSKAKGCFAGVLLPDVDRFYTVREGLLTQYEIAPFKKTDSVSLDWEPLKAMGSSWCGILISADHSKLIIYFPKKVFLLDARTGQILSWLERPQGTSIASAVLNNNELVLLEDAPEGGGRDWYKLTIWDLSTLKLKKEIPQLGRLVGVYPDQGPHPSMLKTLGKIYLASDDTAAVLNSKTYAPELTINFGQGKPKAFRVLPKISRDFEKIYVQHAREVIDRLAHKQTTYDEVKDDEVLVINQDTRELTLTNTRNLSKEAYHSNIALGRNGSRNKDYVMLSPVFIGDVSTGEIYSFRQYESGEAILIERNRKYLLLTPGARKYLMMKNAAGQVVPINDATFVKYNNVAGNK